MLFSHISKNYLRRFKKFEHTRSDLTTKATVMVT
jgi:hypothetical protein